MIKTEIGYLQTLEILKDFEEEIERKKARYLPEHPALFNIYAGGTIAEIEKLREEVAEYERTRKPVFV